MPKLAPRNELAASLKKLSLQLLAGYIKKHEDYARSTCKTKQEYRQYHVKCLAMPYLIGKMKDYEAFKLELAIARVNVIPFKHAGRGEEWTVSI